MEEYPQNSGQFNKLQSVENAAKKFTSLYKFFYTSSKEIHLTEYGWAIFKNRAPETSTKYNSVFNLPVSINHKGEISRVHLWKPETKGIELTICHPREFKEDLEYQTGIRTPVQYAQGGGSYLLFVRTPQKILMNKKTIINPFAEYDEMENIAFF